MSHITTYAVVAAFFVLFLIFCLSPSCPLFRIVSHAAQPESATLEFTTDCRKLWNLHSILNLYIFVVYNAASQTWSKRHSSISE